MKIVIDLMGGDKGYVATVPAVLSFLSSHPLDEYYLVGTNETLSFVKDQKNIHKSLAKEVLAMDADPLSSLHAKDSSLYIAFKTFLDEKADCLISAGSSAAILSFGVMKVKRLSGVTRPAFITSMPTIKKGVKFVALDLGANSENTATELYQFAKMGEIYYRVVYGKDRPLVGLLNNGTESDKGNSVTKEAYKLIEGDKEISFVGNVEGRTPLYGGVDVLVMDGFSGNVFLKTMEGSCKAMSDLIKRAFKRNFLSKIGYLLTHRGIVEMKETMDYKNVGGAMLLGVDGVIVKAHGNSDERSFYSSIAVAYESAKKEILKGIKEELEKI
jgi:glycerol-3-phosphate acyltransferase PlsX